MTSKRPGREPGPHRPNQTQPKDNTVTDSNTDTTSRPFPMEGAQPPPSINYPYGFGYARKTVALALEMLQSHQYNRVIADLTRANAYLDRMAAGWNPEDVS